MNHWSYMGYNLVFEVDLVKNLTMFRKKRMTAWTPASTTGNVGSGCLQLKWHRGFLELAMSLPKKKENEKTTAIYFDTKLPQLTTL